MKTMQAAVFSDDYELGLGLGVRVCDLASATCE